RSRLDEQLALLNRELISMGAMCEEVISLAAEALMRCDTAIAARVIPIDGEIDRKERDIETLCLRLLLQQQPVARDLRQISAALKMITDMERIGDQAADIAEIIGYLGGRNGNFGRIGEMAKATIKMVTEAVDAYVKRDVAGAHAVIDYDDVVDDLFVRVKDSLIADIAANPEDGEYALDLLMIAKYFERIGDHAVNIAEWVEFSLTGIHKGEAEL
ncbi:MAG TPA: phosphate signaling complex protein PhoU, partial [Clostridia bacterium]|nr:phosphate signaling complex protein PhoU [Clostridia bacterium]